MDSPPKRMTRARAAAKAGASAVKTTRIITAAARAKAAGASALSTTSTSTATKRKTRADEDDDNDREGDARARRRRGRPSQITGTNDASHTTASLNLGPARAARTTRASQKPIIVEQPKEEAKTTTRGRPRKNTVPSADQLPENKPTVSTRTRAGAMIKAATGVKKSVKFDETDKENIEPASKKGANASSLRSAPARRPPTPASKATRSAAAARKKEPLSPKKVTQIPVLRNDDDAASHGSPRRNGQAEQINVEPVKKSVEPAIFDADVDSTITVNTAILNVPDAVFGSPPRRPPTSPNRDTLKSPAKKMGAIFFPGSLVKPRSFSQDNDAKTTTSFNNALFQTPAKRPPSPIKGMAFPSTSKAQSGQDSFKASLFRSPAKRAPLGLKSISEKPAAAAICETPAMKPIAASTSLRFDSRRRAEDLILEEEQQDRGLSEASTAEIEIPENPKFTSRFNGRLSDVVPRDSGHTDLEEEEEVDLVNTYSFYEEASDGTCVPAQAATPNRQYSALTKSIIDFSAKAGAPEAVSTPNQKTTPQGPMFQLRDKDVDPCHDMTTMSDSDDELDVDKDLSTFTPRFTGNRRSTMGLTNLTQTLGTWATEGRETSSAAIQSVSGLPRATTVVPVAEISPMKPSFFEDQMQVQEEQEEDSGDVADGEISDPSFDEGVVLTGEDLALAEEAEEMSHMHESPCVDRSVVKSFSDSLSEASQEYGDENELPIDPALAGPRIWPPTTPGRPAPRACSTTTKVPLKPADESSPTKSGRFSASRIPSNGTGGLPKSATVISYSPEKRRNSGVVNVDQEPSTPESKCDIWSDAGTPSCAPRNEANASLLRGAVVFVDVHTSEGADASLIFVDLLTQMGAKCVKTWPWNPDSASSSEPTSNRIGITHVVFKDGGKRTMEKVRKSNGVVQCVGVSWVLDCEKEGEWLDEARYLIDTSLVPRGGARRRKSMEPKALSNQNGTIVSTPAKQTGSYNRRQSGIWVQTPPEQTGGDQAGDDIEWSEFILTPVPKTPGPETVSKYAMDELDTQSDDNSRMSLSKEEMLMRTCPPKTGGRGPYDQLENAVLSPHKDERVLMRLMAARRKSMQFAPKIASPLSKSWY